LEDIAIGETLADPERPVALPPIYIEEPTVRMTFEVNTSPFAGKEGRWGTSRKLRERLFDELNHDVALRVAEMDRASAFLVSGRGELHLVILIEKMRREGYEFQVSRPEVILRQGEHGEVLEPYEEVYIETGPDTVGGVVEMLAARRGQMLDMVIHETKASLSYRVPVRGLLGFRYQFMTATRGLGVFYTNYYGYLPQAGPIASRQTGSLVASDTGLTTAFGLKNAHIHGTLFLEPGVEIYEGMVVGERQRAEDLPVNVCKKRHLTNVRASVREIDVRLPPPRQMSLDEAMEYLADDELLEVTPASYRMRKRILGTRDRGKQVNRARDAAANAD
jgi:GTP-binding protein